jgi:preprotein translocase SecE subunit
VTAIILSRRARVYEGALNVAREMNKVTWPTGDETKYAMKVVIITTIIVAMILFLFDVGAKLLTDKIFELGGAGTVQ